MTTLTVPATAAGTRLDVWLSAERRECSRARWQVLIKAGHVVVDGRTLKPHYPLSGGERIEFEIPPPEPVTLEPEAIPLDILYEDPDLAVINKPPDLVVHPGSGHRTHTLVHALLFHCPDLAGIGGELRPGIVHRLDKDTSGVMVVAKSDPAMRGLRRQFKARNVDKHYLALVWGQVVPARGTIQTLVGRDPNNRKKMSANPPAGREATTHYDVVETYEVASLLRLKIETGRTHQIRVHMAHIRHPVVGDRQYGRSRKTELPAPANRQMLHAERLAFDHPLRGDRLEFTAPLPEDMRVLIQAFRGPSP